jgi:stage V sporulation protein K
MLPSIMANVVGHESESFGSGIVLPSNGDLLNEQIIGKLGQFPEVKIDLLRTTLHTASQFVGLENVKDEIRDVIARTIVTEKRERLNIGGNIGLPSYVFEGNAGTCKTSFARILGQVYNSLGCLSKGHFIRASRRDFVAGFIGQSAEKTANLVDRARGGILFIDEAYSLTATEPSRTKSDSFAQESVSTLVDMMDEYRHDLIVIAALYSSQREQFLNSNIGLRSRFSHTLSFKDYNASQLTQIFVKFLKAGNFEVNPELVAGANVILTVMKDSATEGFGNGREARNLYEHALDRQSSRMVREGGELTRERLTNLTLDDLPFDNVLSLSSTGFRSLIRASHWIGYDYNDIFSKEALPKITDFPELAHDTRELLREHRLYTS